MSLAYLRQLMDLAHLEHLLERFPQPSHRGLRVEPSDERAWRLVTTTGSPSDASVDDDGPRVIADAIPDRATAHYLLHAFTEWPDTVAQLARVHAALTAALDAGDEHVKQQVRATYDEVSGAPAGEPDEEVAASEEPTDEASAQEPSWLDGLGM